MVFYCMILFFSRSIKYFDGTPMSQVTPVTIWHMHPHYHSHTKVNIMVMNGWHPFPSMSTGHPILETGIFQTLTLNLEGQGHGRGQRARSSWDLTLKNPRSRSWLRSSQRSRSHSIPSIHPTDALPFHFTLIGTTLPEIWPKECLTLKKHIQIFQQNFSKI